MSLFTAALLAGNEFYAVFGQLTFVRKAEDHSRSRSENNASPAETAGRKISSYLSHTETNNKLFINWLIISPLLEDNQIRLLFYSYR